VKKISICAMAFWWFLAIGPRSITVVGPFYDEPQCRQVQTVLFEDEDELKVSACWSDTVRPVGPHR
jgi:hypothetical protein